MLLSAAFVLPAVVTCYSTTRGIAAFAAILVAGLLLLEREPAGVILSYVMLGIIFLNAALFGCAVAARQLAEARRGLLIVRSRGIAAGAALDRADVPIFVLGHQQSILAANGAAWRATGVQSEVYQKFVPPFEIEPEAALCLMNKSSAREMRGLMDWLAVQLEEVQPGLPIASRLVTLRDCQSRERTFTVVFERAQGPDVVMIAAPVLAPT